MAEVSICTQEAGRWLVHSTPRKEGKKEADWVGAPHLDLISLLTTVKHQCQDCRV